MSSFIYCKLPYRFIKKGAPYNKCQLRLERPVEDRQVTDNVNDTADNDGAMIISDLRSFVSSKFESILFIEFIFTFLYVKYEVFYLIEIARWRS